MAVSLGEAEVEMWLVGEEARVERRGRAGGTLVIGQSGGATAVINATLVGAIVAALASGAFTRVLGAAYGVEGALRGEFVDLGGISAETLEALRRTPSAALGSCRYRLREGDAERALAQLDAVGAGAFLYIGGNDSADTAHQLAVASGDRLRVICAPKTIDNDLPDTDHCPGYGSAARFIALATMDSARCTEAMPSHYPVKLIEVMGRDAGWLAAAAALGKEREEDPPHLIYFPERPLSPERFLAETQAAYERYGSVVAVVAETVRDAQGTALGALGSQGVDAFGHALLSGAAQYLTGLARAELGLRARFDKPGDLQRMSSVCVSVTDREEAERVGAAAVAALLAGETDQMVTLVRQEGGEYRCETGLTGLERVANTLRPFPAEYVTADGVGVTEAYRAYALPLLGEPLPRHAHLLRRGG